MYASITKDKGITTVSALKHGKFYELKDGSLLQVIEGKVRKHFDIGQWAILDSKLAESLETSSGVKKEKKSKASKKSSTLSKNMDFMRALTPSEELAKVIGKNPMPRTKVVKKLWSYIKKHGLQDVKNRRMIRADDLLRPIFKADEISMFDMTKLVSQHLK